MKALNNQATHIAHLAELLFSRRNLELYGSPGPKLGCDPVVPASLSSLLEAFSLI